MSDTLTILRHSSALMSKLWRRDGTVDSYGDGKFFAHTTLTVNNLVELSLRLNYLERQPRHCMTRGKLVDEAITKPRDV